MSKHCCNRIQSLYATGNSFGPNFRVIEISEEFKKQALERGLDLNEKFRFLITQGYNQMLSSESTTTIFIKFCPFCGRKLSDIYGDKSCVNETNHIW